MLLAALAVAPFGALGHSTATGPGLGPSVGGKCPGTSVVANYSGNLSVEGGPAPGPSVANVTLMLSFDYEINYTPHNGNSSFSCSTAVDLSVTNQTGAFALNASIPSATCSKTSCTSYSGPFGPVRLSPRGGAPAGYFASAHLGGLHTRLAFVAALSGIALSPADPGVLSVNAPLSVRANATAGDGRPSPATVTLGFSLSGNGWTMANGSSSGEVVLTASDGASPGTLAVDANGSYGNTTLAGVSVVLPLTAVPTTILDAGVAPTELDVGTAATLNLTGSGAPGYVYRATVLPGLGEKPISAACPTTSQASGTDSIDCAIALVYHSAGTAQPVVNLSNGPSTSTWSLPVLNVSHALSVVLGTGSLVAYSGS
ncbi:MAG: hypothetical protein L3K09_03340, partial [Thermoplasmata archaeon]|nr:hypothetical protein [Thermoplasmata archaeon]